MRQAPHETASSLAEHYARAYGVPAEFVKAVIDAESGWQPYVISTKGAVGIMQLTAPAAFTFGVTNRFRVDENIRGGVAYLAHLMRLFNGELRLVAAAYYAGEARIQKLRARLRRPGHLPVRGDRGTVLSKTPAGRNRARPERSRERSIATMKGLNVVLGILCACCICVAQVPEITPQVVGRAVQEGQVTVVYLAPRFATAIRMPDAINSVVLGDPDAFSAEHSDREPRIVVVKPITVKADANEPLDHNRPRATRRICC